tara:strand:+ start:8435 stop:9361 length:927 start_codon:yes stop_codon:yes gene_type:complete
VFGKLKSYWTGKSESKSVQPDGFLSKFIRRLRGQVLDQSSKKLAEEFLIKADVGSIVTEQIITEVEKKHYDKKVLEGLRDVLTSMLRPYEVDKIELNDNHTTAIIIIGINGAGKTTTIAKLAHYFKEKGKKVSLAAGDTFRAAAIDQLGQWASTLNVDMVSQKQGADSASVIYDAYASCRAKNADILIADTAGRVHTKVTLLKELEKIVRVLKKQSEQAPEHIWLVLDGTIGQSSIDQARVFAEHFPVTGLILTKLDSSAKGGSILSICQSLKLPIIAIGTGEKVEDFARFKADNYVDQLLEWTDDSE